MNDENSNPNYFVRVLIVLLAGFCGYLVFASFKNGEPAYTISAAAFSTLVLMTIIVLSEAFNHLSLGKVLSLSKKITEEKTAKEEVKKENAELRENLLKLSIAIRQTQTNTTINALGPDWLKLPGVTAADKSEEDSDEPETSTEQALPEPQNLAPAQPSWRTLEFPQRFKWRRLIEGDALVKFLKKAGLPDSEIQREVKFTDAFRNIDPIMERNTIFDGYLKVPAKEYFFDVVTNVSPMMLDRLYVMLAKIHFYRQAKQIPADLTLIIAKLPDSEQNRQFQSSYSVDRLLTTFQPAIANNLLRVEVIDFTERGVRAISKNNPAE